LLKDIDHDSIGYRIRTARKSKELTQKELSAQVGVGPNYLATVERGTKTASEVLLKRIALATDVTLNWLVTGEGEKPTILPGAVLSEKELREIITERAFGMSVEEAIQRGKVCCVEGETLQEKYCLLTQGRFTQRFFSFQGCRRMPVSELDAVFRDFVAEVAFSNEITAERTSHTFVLTSESMMHHLCEPPRLLNANTFLLFIDPEKKEVMQEKAIAGHQSPKMWWRVQRAIEAEKDEKSGTP
jgi:transcriptional regulator with XRE-family HTH domain